MNLILFYLFRIIRSFGFASAFLFVVYAFADEICSIKETKCVEEAGVRNINGSEISKPCWRYKIIQECTVPSLNDCHTIDRNVCSFTLDECAYPITIEGINFCANNKRYYTCKTIDEYEIEKDEVVINQDAENAKQRLLCDSFCLDGNCEVVSSAKSGADINDELVSSIAALQMLSGVRQGLIDTDKAHFNIFQGTARTCTRKIFNYTNCCKDLGWGKDLGLASCNKDDAQLAEDKNKGKCVALGSYCDSEIGIWCEVEKYRYCCYPNVLSKIIQVEGRKQFGRGFGDPEHPDCGGFTLEEIAQIDFAKIDFKEFYDREIASRIKTHDPNDVGELIKRSMPSLEKQGNGLSREKLQRGVEK